MKKLVYSRNILYIILITFLCFMPVLTAYFMSHDSSYFSSNTNFSIHYNGSDLSTKQINDKFLDYSNKNNVSITKRIFREKNNRFETKTIIFGNENHVRGINNEKLKYAGDNSNLLTDYAIFNDNNPQRLFNYMNHIGLQVNIWNPISIKSILNDTIGVINNFYFNYLIIFLILIIILLNIFILFKKRKYYSIKKLFKGYSNSFSYISQVFNESKYLILSSTIIELILYLSTSFLSPDLTKLALISSIFLNIIVTLIILISTLLLVFIFSKFSMVEILKGKGNYNNISVLSLIMISLIFFAFANVIKANIDSNIQINNLSKSNYEWNKLNNYNLLDFNKINPSDSSQKYLSNKIVNNFSEKNLLLSMNYPYHLSNQLPINALMTNTNYFKYQNIKYSNGKRITPKSLDNNAVTLLTNKKIDTKDIKTNYAIPLNVKLKDIKVINFHKQKFYKYLTLNEDQTKSFSNPEQVLVLNLHEASKISPIVSQNLLAWASQRQLMFNMKNISDIKKISSNVKNVENISIFRAKIQHKIYYNHFMLLFNLFLATFILIICCYFTIYILFSSKRKKLFLMKINGKTFLGRYASIYISLVCSIIPGTFYLFTISDYLSYMIISSILLIFTLQIWINEKSNYTLLKGKL